MNGEGSDRDARSRGNPARSLSCGERRAGPTSFLGSSAGTRRTGLTRAGFNEPGRVYSHVMPPDEVRSDLSGARFFVAVWCGLAVPRRAARPHQSSRVGLVGVVLHRSERSWRRP
jgi:hypothetical protein